MNTAYGSNHKSNDALHFIGPNETDSSIVLIRCHRAGAKTMGDGKYRRTSHFQVQIYIPSSSEEYDSGATFFPCQEASLFLDRDDFMNLIDRLHNSLNDADEASDESISKLTAKRTPNASDAP